MKKFSLLALILLFSSCDTNEMFKDKGYGTQYAFALMYMDSAKAGLDRFYQDNGHYPNIEGRYFFDSIKPYFTTLKAMIFTDSSHFPIDNFLEVDSCFLAVGSNSSPIIYRYRGKEPYLLYWVGKNDVDDMGKGDDIIYRKAN